MGVLDEIVSRASWGAKYGRDKTLRLGQKTEMHVHHSVMKCPGPDKCDDVMRTIERQHHDQWGYTVGYNVAWCHGRFFEGAGLLRRGQHCPNHNTTSFGVVYIGDGREPFPMQLETDLDRLWDELSNWRGMRLYLFGHRDHRATQCPGNLLYDVVHAKFPNANATPPAPPSAPTPDPDNDPYDLEKVMQNPVIAEGSSSHHAKIVKGLLAAHATDICAYALGGFDEIDDWVRNMDFGPKSAEILAAWQKATGVLVSDGICGPKSWAWLCGLPVG